MDELAVEIGILLLKKMKIEEKMKKTFKCFLRKCFSCMGMKSIEEELKIINKQLFDLKVPKSNNLKLRRTSSI